MRWSSSLSVEPKLDVAIADAVKRLCDGLGGDRSDLLVIFVSTHHQASYERVPDRVRSFIDCGCLIGCSAGGVIGAGHEIENRPGLSLTAAVLPDVEVTAFHLESAEIPAAGSSTEGWKKLVGSAPPEEPHFVLLPDPFTFDAERFVQGLDAAFPQSRKVGGLASGGREPGVNALFLGDQCYRSGLVGVALRGNIELDTLVAQGCRPIGLPMFVTRCREHVLLGLDGRLPLEVLKDLHRRLNPRDQELFRHSLFLGIVMNKSQAEYHHGDFLIRNIVGINEETGALAVGAHLREGTVVQFHLRDAGTSAEELEELLARYEAEAVVPPEGSLLFSCLGRGAFLYGRPDHDTDVFRQHLGNVPLGGFFCNGEIGPVQGKTFLHGYTSSFGLFRPRVRLAS